MSKPTMRITTFRIYSSNAEIFANGNGVEGNYFNVAFDDVSSRARYSGGDILKRAILRRLREQHPEFRFINQKYY